jgi:replicative DNA helicase
MKTDRLPPYSPEAEMGVMSCCMIEASCIDTCRETFKGELRVLYELRNQTLFAVLEEMHRERKKVDPLTVVQCLKDKGKLEEAGGDSHVMGLYDVAASHHNLPDYLEIVQRKYIMRRLLAISTAVGARTFEDAEALELIGMLEQELLKISEFTTPKKMHNSVTLAERLVDDLERRFNNQGKFTGVSTGFSRLDQITWGLQAGEQSIIASRPSVGKTALACNITDHACLVNQVPTLFVTCEMSPDALSRRLLSCHCGISMGDIRRGEFTERDFKQFALFKELYQQAPLYIVDAVSGITSEEVTSEVRRHVRINGVKLVIVDYLQKVKPMQRHEKRTYEVGAVSGELKSCAVNNNVAVLVLAQLNRESDKDKGRPPRLSDLADSGQIERDGDLIGLLHRDKKKSEAETTLIIAKQRDGETGAIPLTWRGEFCRFEDHRESPGEPEEPKYKKPYSD